MKQHAAAVLLFLSPALAHACSDQPTAGALPPGVSGFVAPGTRLLSLSGADLDRDGREDYVLVLERQGRSGWKSGQRPLRVLVRQPDGSLEEAARNDDVVYCSSCGGVFGDPYGGVTARTGGFTVSHYGGSASRWSVEYTFAYSRRDKAWQLVRVEEHSFDVADPEDVDVAVYEPPGDFGKIDLGDFDPDDWKGRGPR